MSILTQGKTNWKFLLIVFILAVIVGGGILWLAEQQKVEQQKAVTIHLSQLPEVKKPKDIIEDKCKDIPIYSEEVKCYTDLAKETKNESYCEKIKTSFDKANCYLELKDWQVYRNEKYGFEIEYPEGWDIREINNPFEVSVYKIDTESLYDDYRPRNMVIFSIIDKNLIQIRNNVKVGHFDYDASTNRWFLLSYDYVLSGRKTPSCPYIVSLNEEIKGYRVPGNTMAQDCDTVTYVITNKDYGIKIKDSCGGDQFTMAKISSTLKLINDVKSIEAQCE